MEFTLSPTKDLHHLKQCFEKNMEYCEQSTLMRSIEFNRPQMVEFLLQRGLVKPEDLQCDYPLHAAAEVGSVDIVSLLLKHGYNADSQNMVGDTPLHVAAEGMRLECVKIILDHGAKTDLVNSNSDSVLHSAARTGDYEIMKEFIDRGCDVGARNGMKDTPLHTLAAVTQLDDVRAAILLLEHGASLTDKYQHHI